jgi:NitT/TauT family transport system permease protein
MHVKLPIRGQLTRRSERVLGVVGLGLVVAVWCFLTYGGFVRKIFLPTPTSMWEGLRDWDAKGWLWPSFWRSFFRVSKALCLVILVGVPIGVLMGAFKPFDALLQRIVSGAKSVPTTAITGVVVLWFGLDEVGKIVFLFLGAIFFMILLVRNAIAGVPDAYVRVALDLGANRRQMIWQVLLPGALPQIWEAIIVCNGIMWTYIVLAEFISNSEKQLGMGYLLWIGSRTQDPGKVFAMLVVIAVTSVLTDYALQFVRRRFLDW